MSVTRNCGPLVAALSLFGVGVVAQQPPLAPFIHQTRLDNAST